MRGLGVAARPPLPAPSCAAALDTGSACVAGALAFALVARAVRRLPVSLGARAAVGRRTAGTARIALRAREAGFDVPGIGNQPVNSKPRRPSGGNWMFPGSDLSDDDLLDDKPDSKPTAGRAQEEAPQTFAVWIARRKDLPALMASWADAAEDDKTRAYLARLAAEEVPKGWALWALCDGASTPGGPGFYMVPPVREPKALVMLEAVDQELNNIQHIAMNPKEQGPESRKAVEDWLASLKPKRAVVCRPEELALFGLELPAGDKGTKVSKGL